ncbi:hypothetical protein chiPu_0004023 [Chiloscyllium punctatum]|uniref:Uncharacterized protein n=1 Tax=Chiloscyllium punctatum TaxID=137246 RepID=A0A401S5D0_CHIPU|nr:hypothetical protein [Chiloscyllium punctatum]
MSWQVRGKGQLNNGTISPYQDKTVVPFAVKLKMQELEEEKRAVEMLNMWEPASPLLNPVISNDVKKK